MSRNTTWYIEAVGHTNEVISRELPAESAVKDILCQDGEERNFWRCNYSFITKLKEQARTERLKFKVFSQEGQAPARPWKFLEKSRRKTLPQLLKKGQLKSASAIHN